MSGYEILELLIEATRSLGLAELRIRWCVVHARLNEGVPLELPLRSVIVDLEIRLIAAGEGGKGGLVAIGPILVVE